MSTNNHKLAQVIAEAIMKLNSNFSLDFNSDTVASIVYDAINTETRSDAIIPEWTKAPEQVVDELNNVEFETNTLLCEMMGYIQKHTDQKTFENHMEMIKSEHDFEE